MNNRHRIWWVASYPKSGSTWVRMFVNAFVTGFPVEINSAFQYVSGDLQPHQYQLAAAQPITDMEDPDCIYYRPAVLMNYLYTSATRDVALKTHHAKVEMDGIPMIPPRLSKGALYVVRDPRDVVVSFADHMGIEIDAAIDLMNSNDHLLVKAPYALYHVLLSWSSHVDSWTVGNKDVRTEVVRYEDLLSRPLAQFRQVVKALGLEPNEERLKFAEHQTRFDRLRREEEGDGFREKGKGDRFFRQGKAGGWRDILTPEQAARIEENHHGTMGRWGYEAEFYRPKKANGVPQVVTVASGTVRKKEQMNGSRH